jgi:hypothetical protein
MLLPKKQLSELKNFQTSQVETGILFTTLARKEGLNFIVGSQKNIATHNKSANFPYPLT